MLKKGVREGGVGLWRMGERQTWLPPWFSMLKFWLSYWRLRLKDRRRRSNLVMVVERLKAGKWMRWGVDVSVTSCETLTHANWLA